MLPKRSRNGKQREGNGTISDHILANASTVLEVAKEFAPLIPMPIFGSLFATGKIIIDAVQVSLSINMCPSLFPECLS